jgi:hypothetical protein
LLSIFQSLPTGDHFAQVAAFSASRQNASWLLLTGVYFALTVEEIAQGKCRLKKERGEGCVRYSTPWPGLWVGAAFACFWPPQGLLDFMTALRKEGISVADIDIMAKTNPALMLGLKP